MGALFSSEKRPHKARIRNPTMRMLTKESKTYDIWRDDLIVMKVKADARRGVRASRWRDGKEEEIYKVAASQIRGIWPGENVEFETGLCVPLRGADTCYHGGNTVLLRLMDDSYLLFDRGQILSFTTTEPILLYYAPDTGEAEEYPSTLPIVATANAAGIVANGELLWVDYGDLQRDDPKQVWPYIFFNPKRRQAVKLEYSSNIL